MSAISHNRGHEVVFINGTWVYSDDGTPAAIDRPCKRCGRMPTVEGHDACIGHIDGANSACCGHGVDTPILLMEG